MAAAISSLASPWSFRSCPGIKIPKLIYGTAWKKDQTANLVYQALKAGFKGIDTAAQPKHYKEDLVGEGLRRAINNGLVRRDEIYIQTKFTPPGGQNPNDMPYSLSQSFEDRIHASIASSLKNFGLGVDMEASYIDCLVLHSPFQTLEETRKAWRIFAQYVPKQIKSLGISNTTLPVIQALIQESVPPSVVQNRFYPATQWDVHLRRFCREQGITFQSFWTLTGNPELIKGQAVQKLSKDLEALEVKDAEVMSLYCLVLGLEGVAILDGTTKEERMRGDLEGLATVGRWVEGEGKHQWADARADFRTQIKEQGEIRT